MSQLNKLVNNLGYTFNDPALLAQALIHRSYHANNNERLEFLGDAVLELVITTELYQRHPSTREGKLSRMRASLVNGVVLADIAKDLDITPHLRLGKGEIRNGGRARQSILANTMEAIIGAIYLDSNFNTCYNCIMRWYDSRLAQLAHNTVIKDAKSRLQEWLQAHKMPLPTYSVTISGQSHQQTFTVICQVAGLNYTTEGISSSRRRAEQIAAAYFLEKLND